MLKITKKHFGQILIATTLLIALLSPIAIVNAAGNNDFRPTPLIRPDTLPGPDDKGEINEKGNRSFLVDILLPRFGVILIGMVGATALLFIIIGGVRFVMIYDNEEAIDKAKKQVTYGIVGLLVALLSYTIVRIVTNFDFTPDENPQENAMQIEEIKKLA